MKKEITATPESFYTSTLTPIELQSTPNVHITFNGLQVDNNDEKNKNIKGTLVIEKKTSKTNDFNDKTKFTRKDIKPYDIVEISLDTKSTYALGKGLYEYYKIFGGKQTNPYEEVKYVESTDDIERLKKLLLSNDQLPELLKSIDTDILSSALNVKNLKRLEKEIEENMKNPDESYWQNFFSKNAWALSQLFASPLMICGGARYVGGKNITNSNAKITDFIYKNNLTNNIALIEIKTPCTKLFSDSDYRSQISNQSHELVGAVNQLLVQKQTCYENYTAIRSSSIDDLGEDFYVQNIKSILLIGKINDLSVDNKKQFERYRNELRSIEIVTFDELLEKVKALLELLTK